MAVMNALISRSSKAAPELAAALNKALKAHPECKDIMVSKLMPLANVQVGLANLDAEFTATPGTTMSPECKRVAISVSTRFRNTSTWLADDQAYSTGACKERIFRD